MTQQNNLQVYTNNVSFSIALEAVKRGLRIYREGWNGKGIFVYYVPAANYLAQTGVAKEHYGETAMVPYQAYFAIKNVDNTISTWVPSVNDCLASDWFIAGKESNEPVLFEDESRVAVPHSLLLSVCHAIEFKRVGTRTLAEIQRYAFGDKSIALTITPPPPTSPSVNDPSLTLEQEIQAKANTAPRVTPADVKDQIIGETYTVLPSGRVTVCELTLKNGFTVRGESAVVCIENFNESIGRKVARTNAENQVYQLLGFLLRNEIYGDA